MEEARYDTAAETENENEKYDAQVDEIVETAKNYSFLADI